MTGREKMIRALNRQPIEGHVPHFELTFFLTMEALGAVHPLHRTFSQWDQMSAKEQALQLHDIANVLIKTAEKYQHSAIFIHYPAGTNFENIMRIMELIREKTGDAYFLMMHGDPTFSIPDGEQMMSFSTMMYEEPEKLHAQAERNLQFDIAQAEAIAKHPGLLDGFAMCCDYCFNVNPFFSPDAFAEFITPYLSRSIQAHRDLGFYSIKHTDGNIMPILDQLVACRPDALHSLDPQGGVSLAEVGALYGNQVSLVGNVNCALLQTGTEEECIADVRRTLREGMALPGYIFSTSNCIYTGLPLERYELMHDIWRQEGIYPS